MWLGMPPSGLLTVTVLVAASDTTNLTDGIEELCGGVTGIFTQSAARCPGGSCIHKTSPIGPDETENP
jgi:hypothetical protein